MHSLRGHHGVKSTDVHGNLIGHDIGVNTVMALRALSGPYETEPGSLFFTGLGEVGNGATKVHQTSSALFADRALGPGSDPILFDSALSASVASMDVEVTEKGSRGL
jgi:hypothetical protein